MDYFEEIILKYLEADILLDDINVKSAEESKHLGFMFYQSGLWQRDVEKRMG